MNNTIKRVSQLTCLGVSLVASHAINANAAQLSRALTGTAGAYFDPSTCGDCACNNPPNNCRTCVVAGMITCVCGDSCSNA